MDGKENSILLALRQIISAVSLKSSFEEAIASLVEKIRSTMHRLLLFVFVKCS